MNIKYLLLFAGCLFSRLQYAQIMEVDRISLQECLQLVSENYPLVAQTGVIDQMTQEALNKVNAYWQPQVNLNAQATYQSDVVGLPIESPLFEIPELSKDQYKATIDVTQVIYDGGNSHQQKTLQSLNGEIEKQKVAIEIYKAKEKVVQLYTSILLAEQQAILIQQVISDLQVRKASLGNGLANGVITQNTIDLIDAEILKSKQKFVEVNWAKITAMGTLTQLIGVQLTEHTAFDQPAIDIMIADTVNERPELDLLNIQTAYALRQKDFASAITLPKLSAFVQGGYGRPGLNYLLDEFDFFYIAGIKLNYPLWQGQTRKMDASLYSLNMLTINNQRNVFLLNSSVQAIQQTSEMDKLDELMQLDQQIIEIRKKTRSTAEAQLDNGVITATDYVNEVNAGLQAQQNLAIHQTQLIAAKTNYLINLGKL